MRTHAAAEVLLDRHGIVTRGAVVAEGTVGGFAGVYRVLAALEETGRIRRGYFVEGLGAAQFASAGAVDRVRAFASRPGSRTEPARGLVLAAADPANPYGAALPWPGAAGTSECSARTTSPPGRRPGGPAPAGPAGGRADRAGGRRRRAVRRTRRPVVAVVHRRIRGVLAAAAEALSERVRSGRIGSLTITKDRRREALTSAGASSTRLTAAGFTHDAARARLRPPWQPGPMRGTADDRDDDARG